MREIEYEKGREMFPPSDEKGLKDLVVLIITAC